MANFLANLFERFHKPGAEVQARPRSRFEPYTPLVLSSWVQTEEQYPASEKMLEPHDDFRVRAATTDLEEQTINPTQAALPRSEIKPHHGPRITKEQQPTTAAPTHSAPPAQLGYLVVQPHFQANRSETEAQPVDASFVFSEGADELEPERGANLEEGSAHWGAQASPRLADVHPKTGKNTVIRPRPQPTAKSPNSTSSINPQMIAKNEESPAEPVVNVTIGRVEVRAIPPAKPAEPQKSSRPSPVMSLDEYLKNRDQEGHP